MPFTAEKQLSELTESDPDFEASAQRVTWAAVAPKYRENGYNVKYSGFRNHEEHPKIGEVEDVNFYSLETRYGGLDVRVTTLLESGHIKVKVEDVWDDNLRPYQIIEIKEYLAADIMKDAREKL